jgi:hypothetical protein
MILLLSLGKEIRMADATYNLNGGFKPTMKRFADLSGPDFFPTPRWATFALIENEKFSGEIWESACGDGTMSRVLEQTGQAVRSSDLYDRGYGEIGFDFLEPQWSADNIVTNPPYNCAEGFVASGVKHSNRRPASGFSASGSRSTQAASNRRVAAQPLMLGLSGTRTRRVEPN